MMLRMGVIQRCVRLPNSSLGLIYKAGNGVSNQQTEISFQETGQLRRQYGVFEGRDCVRTSQPRKDLAWGLERERETVTHGKL